MVMHKIKKGLNIPIKGEPEQKIYSGKSVSKIALLGPDYVGMLPKFEIPVGQGVKTGEVLFIDKKRSQIKYCSPGTGLIKSINRGERRRFLSIIIELEKDDFKTFDKYTIAQINELSKENIKKELLESGLWASLRRRPFGDIPEPEGIANSIFVTAMDTNPLSGSIATFLEGLEEYFKAGLILLSKFTNGKLYLCKSPDDNIPVTELSSLCVEEFKGPHPAGNPGTHIHFLDPVCQDKEVWQICAQDVVDMGYLFLNGHIRVDKIVALGGVSVKNPRLIKTRKGACLTDLLEQELTEGEHRIISGSVLSGRKTGQLTDYLGHYDQQISVIPEGRERKLFGWIRPGISEHSVKNVVLSKLMPKKKFSFTTNTNGSLRAIVPVGSYEKVFPFDILPNYLLRALACNDVEEAMALGCLELIEEDLALCSYVCPSKIDHMGNLRRNLDIIKKEG